MIADNGVSFQVGQCRVSTLMMDGKLCDITLISIDNLPFLTCTNRVSCAYGDGTVSLDVFSGDATHLIDKGTCHIYQNNFGSSPGRVDCLSCHYFDPQAGVTLSDCISVRTAEGKLPFSKAGDSGKMVVWQPSMDMRAYGIGTISGSIWLKLHDDHGLPETLQRSFTVLSPLPRILRCINEHPSHSRGLEFSLSSFLPPTIPKRPPSSTDNLSSSVGYQSDDPGVDDSDTDMVGIHQPYLSKSPPD